MDKRNDNPSSMDGNDSWFNKLNNGLEQRATQLLITGILAVAASLIANKTTTEVRHDPCTGTQCKAMELRIRALEQDAVLNAQHRAKSSAGYDRIRKNEVHCSICTQQIKELNRRLEKIEAAKLEHHGE